jgi:predicted small secreted protein
MKKTFSLLIIAAVVAVMALPLAGCVTASAIGGSSDIHGLFSGGGAKAAVTDGAQEIASYSTILGLFDSGYDTYATKVKEAEAAGQQITTTVTWKLFLFTTTAYAK